VGAFFRLGRSLALPAISTFGRALTHFSDEEALMKWLLLVAILGVLGIGGTRGDRAPREKVLFEEPFTGKLENSWSWVREDPKAWRIDNGALVVRTMPGHIHGGSNDARNVLIRPLPKSENPLAIEVYLEGEPKVQFEHAGVVWYVDDDNYVSLYQESLGGKVELQMVTEQKGRASYEVAHHGAKGVWLRLLISAGTITTQYRSSEKEAWREVGQAKVPTEVPARAGLTSGGAPRGSERYVRYRTFRVLEVLKE
jgi:regulation of enolase protein 1 (concanavalin A-like superfamily)